MGNSEILKLDEVTRKNNCFGAVDADADTLLLDYFESHPSLKSVQENEAFLVLGRKGSGKTAIFKNIESSGKSSSRTFNPNVRVSANTSKSYPREIHAMQQDMGYSPEEAYISGWRYYLNLALSKLVLCDPKSKIVTDMENYSRIKSFVEDSYGSVNPELNKVFKPYHEIKVKGFMGFGKNGVEITTIPMSNLKSKLEEVNDYVWQNISECLDPELDYFVMFDELDRNFAPGESEYSKQVTGLLLAAKNLYDESRARGLKVHPVVFLRDDIYDQLFFEDKNKITQNSCTSVVWDKERGTNSGSLRSLMEQRFKRVLSDPAATWGGVFDEGEKMPSRQTKYAHICDRTLLRPRDLIMFCNCVAKEFSQRGGEGKFSRDDIHNSRLEYSKYLKRELEDELEKHLQGYRKYINVLTNIGRVEFSREEFMVACERVPDIAGNDLEDALAVLFKFSIIGYLKIGGRTAGSSFVFKHNDADAELPLDSQKFKIHKGLIESLQLKQSKK